MTSTPSRAGSPRHSSKRFFDALATSSRASAASQVQRLVKIGRDEFLPDFLVRKQVGRDEAGRPLHRLMPLEVKYRRDIRGSLGRYDRKLFEEISAQWPDLSVVFVTDHPADGCSCFQILDFSIAQRWEPQDLHCVKDLDIYETTVREYESLVQQIFPLVDRPWSVDRLPSPDASLQSEIPFP